ncbi:hypothetical protein FZ934_25220 (plasmid) [Rhizobium grahamii]|uniref:Uncharacterized protein n=1 Tax=Rhizobium grahamii TaxID=1120045 RepID=A0A5Q0CCK3_9HYPH|nr:MULTISPECIES: hypothetical protein [Rhizobium]QFY63546.1 hypothetical protein FZ934_25220 [Rhizobium grahamii]QRM51691.1 hypothetical protein F3Y33_20425 [Rhizobium sp. BG6]
MKIVLLCDLVAAPGGGQNIFGIRLSGAGLRLSPGDDPAKSDLFKRAGATPLPSSPDQGLDDYLDILGEDAGPLFPWIGGELGFSSFFATAPSAGLPSGTIIASDEQKLLLPASSETGKPNFELADQSWRWLLYTALHDLAGPDRTNSFSDLRPFVLAGLNDSNHRQPLDEIDGGKTLFRYEAFLAGLASMAAPIPHGRLNLVRFTRLDSLPSVQPGERTLLVAAPRLKPRKGSTVFEPDISDPSKIVWETTPAGVVATIPYTTTFNGLPIEAICRAMDPGTSGSGDTSFLDRDTFWVRRTHTGEASDSRKGVAFDDAMASLPAKLSEAFSLAELLVGAIESDAATQSAPIAHAIAGGDKRRGAALLSEAVLIALRDIVGPGCIALDSPHVGDAKLVTGPNGSPVHAAIIEQVNEATPRGVRLQDTDALATAVANADRVFRNAFRLRTPDQEAQLGRWFDILASVLGPALGMPKDGAEFTRALADAMTDNVNQPEVFEPALLRKVVDGAITATNAAAIQIAVWRDAVSGQESLRPWFSAAETAFGSLFEQGFNVVRLLKASNIDLAWTDPEGIWRNAGAPDQTDLDILCGADSDDDRGSIRDSVISSLFGTLCESDASGMTPLEARYESCHGRIGMLPASARKGIASGIDTILRAQRGDWFPQPTVDSDGDTLLSGNLVADAHPVMLQVDRLVVAAQSTTDLNDDMAGYGMMMRRSTPTEDWRCLTAGFAEINPDAGYGAGPKPVEFKSAPRTVLSALPVGYVGRAPQAILPYDNRPVIGDSQGAMKPDDQPSGDVPLVRIIRQVQPRVQERPPAETLLPFLAYGATYEIAPFGISNQGGLPIEIRNNDFPALLDPSKLAEDHFFPPPEAVRRFTYLRRTGIGSLRVDPTATGREAFHPLLLGKDVKPIAEEISVPAIAVEPWNPSASTGSRPLKMKTALLLSNDDGDPFSETAGKLTLTIEPPVTPIEDFDRWIALDEALLNQNSAEKLKLRDFRKAVRTRHAALTAELHELEQKRRRADSDALKASSEQIRKELVIQDPAVDALAISVRRVRRDGALAADSSAPFAPVFVPWRWNWDNDTTAQDPFASRPSINLTCVVQRGTKTAFDSGSRTVAVASGDVVVVQLFAAVRTERFSGKVDPAGERRFDKVVREASVGDVDVVDPTDGGHYRLFSLHEFAVEAASTHLPEPAEIARQISGTIVTADAFPDESEGDFRLDFTRATSAKMDAIGAIAVGAQAWRWTGRPLPPFPFKKEGTFNDFPPVPPADPYDDDISKRAAPPSPGEYPLLWDVAGFAERLGETLDDTPAAVPIAETIASSVATTLPIRIALNSTGRRESTRYLRFVATAYSRYAAAYRAVEAPVLPIKARWESASGWSTPWYRMLRTARSTRALPPPSIRAVLPLTRAVAEGDEVSPVAGVLAVVDGAWFEHSGLGDWMLGGVDIAQRTKFREKGATISATAVEMGPDPLVRAYGLSSASPAERKMPRKHDELRNVAPLTVAGPLGHSFDTGTATGLFLNSSFVISPPEFTHEDPDAWWMAKLSFRRLVLAEATEGYWSDVLLLPAKSTSSQISITQHDTRPDNERATATFTFAASLARRQKNGTKQISQAFSVAAEWSDGACSLAIDGAANKTFALSRSAFDLRVVAVRRVSDIKRDGGIASYAWFDIFLLVKPSGGHWRLAWQTKWFDVLEPDELADADPATTELTVNLTRTVEGARTGDIRVSRSLQISEPTEGRWAQFMPNMAALVRSSRVSLAGLAMQVDPDDTKNLLLSAGGTQWGWLGTNGLLSERVRGRENQGLFNLLLVTKSITSVSGEPDEIFVGLFHSSTGYDSAKKAVGLQPFALHAGGDLTGQALVGRILTVRSGRANLQQADIQKWLEDPWGQFFPPENDEPVDPAKVFGRQEQADVPLQIIEIYAPITVIGTA